MEGFPKITDCSYVLYHAPYFTEAYGTSLKGEDGLSLDSHFRSFSDAAGYPPNQAYIGNIDPRHLPERPWYGTKAGSGPEGPFGAILDEKFLYGLLAFSDSFDLIELEEKFSQQVWEVLGADPVMAGRNLSKLEKGKTPEHLKESLNQGALPLQYEGNLIGCVKPAHPSDVNLGAHTMLENISAKATGVYAVLRLLYQSGIDPGEIEYIIETSEEACGDVNQRGGGNFAKAIGEAAGLLKATGCDVRSFCAGPVHGLLLAASLAAAGTFDTVLVVAGGTTAKLGMNGKKHIEKGLPILEDCMGAFAVLVKKEATGGLIIRTDAVGRHRIGTGASPQAVIGDLVAEPLAGIGLRMSDVDFYAPELQNPEITENAGAGNVTEANLKMIAALAVMKKEMDRTEIPQFIESKGCSGWAPTQGHIPSGIPALGWFLRWEKAGEVKRCMVIGKGSLFLGRMTNLFDGVSLLLESTAENIITVSQSDVQTAAVSGKTVIGLSIPGSEGGAEELFKGAEAFSKAEPDAEIRYFGDSGSDPKQARREMEQALQAGEIHGAVTFHYPFPIGAATVGRLTLSDSGKELYIATTTGTVSTDRVTSLVYNIILGTAAAKACGIIEPVVGLLNLEGAASALKILQTLRRQGWSLSLGYSIRKETLLRGNDLLSGICDVVVCDSLTGNALMKILAAHSTGGKLEVVGSGYGPGLGNLNSPGLINIISRATGAPVVANALAYNFQLMKGNVRGLYKQELNAAEKAGMRELCSGSSYSGASRSADRSADINAAAALEKKAVDSEIEGLDVLEVDKAVEMLSGKGIYAEAGMGCSGPVVMVAEADKSQAADLLRKGGFLQ